MVFGTELKGLLASLCTNSWDSNAFLITRPEGNKSADKINNINTSIRDYHALFFSEKLEIKTVAVCAGSGASVLRGVKADLYLTGEMSHHEVLDASCKGTHVVLCDHSNTERGFLNVVQGRLVDMLAMKVQVIVSEVDRDPLVVV